MSSQNFQMGSLTDESGTTATPCRHRVLINANLAFGIRENQTFMSENQESGKAKFTENAERNLDSGEARVIEDKSRQEEKETQLMENKKSQESGEEMRDFENKKNDESEETQLTENKRNEEIGETRLSEIQNNEELEETQLTENDRVHVTRKTQITDENQNQLEATPSNHGGKSRLEFGGQFNDDALSKVNAYKQKMKKAAMLDLAFYVPLMARMGSTTLGVFEDLQILEDIEADGLQSLEWTVDQMQRINDEEGDIEIFLTLDEDGNILSSRSLRTHDEMKTEDLECHKANGLIEFVGENQTIIDLIMDARTEKEEVVETLQDQSKFEEPLELEVELIEPKETDAQPSNLTEAMTSTLKREQIWDMGLHTSGNIDSHSF